MSRHELHAHAEEVFPLIDLCRVGKLKEVAEWIAAGKPLDPPLNAKRSRRQSPLEIAIQKGFFALAELLFDGGCNPLASGNALADAVQQDEPEIAQLLLDHGVPIGSIHISAVFDAACFGRGDCQESPHPWKRVRAFGFAARTP